MALDNSEQRQLRRIEAQLRRDDPLLAKTLDIGPDQDRRPQWRRLAGRLVGIGLLVALIGLVTEDGVLSVGSVVLGYGLLSTAAGVGLILHHRGHRPGRQRRAPDEQT